MQVPCDVIKSDLSHLRVASLPDVQICLHMRNSDLLLATVLPLDRFAKKHKSKQMESGLHLFFCLSVANMARAEVNPVDLYTILAPCKVVLAAFSDCLDEVKTQMGEPRPAEARLVERVTCDNHDAIKLRCFRVLHKDKLLHCFVDRHKWISNLLLGPVAE